MSDKCIKGYGNQCKQGYLSVNINGKPIRSHRAAYILHHGPIPRGLLIRHLCGNPWCINPDHLAAGTIQENMQDREIHGNTLRNERHGSTVYKDKELLEVIEECYKSNKTANWGAKKLGLHRTHLYKIMAGKFRRDLYPKILELRESTILLNAEIRRLFSACDIIEHV